MIEYDEAIESYETGSRRLYNRRSVSALLSLARTRFAKATEASTSTAVRRAPRPREANSGRPAVRNRTPYPAYTQKAFASLAANTSGLLPYNTDITNGRRKYGSTMLRKSTDQLAAQEKLVRERESCQAGGREENEARGEREVRIYTVQREKEEEEQRQAEAMAERRRKATEEAKEWAARARTEGDEEEIKKQEKFRKAAARKTAKAEESGEDGGPKERKRKRRLKSKKAANSGEDEKEEALFTDDDAATGDAKPRRPRTKKRAIDDDEGENENDLEAGTRRKKRKTFKSKETISDSDEE
ncbi:hypothetical protein BOTBODRAFT_188022 [Botryobasidium botryosum FD-172 SS1]|uniref:Uncharacterized protein n=1 Tax=Botryobasidium botryosum (strain FD-172 SS1) TaxID=930990 RepID=A0A067MQE1_BOTB1|nr:hypothetical protein BOTBODRAFT_188022 [Botryobasidium botryosum FD-172 SS1]